MEKVIRVQTTASGSFSGPAHTGVKTGDIQTDKDKEIREDQQNQCFPNYGFQI